jgi:hypothetical protein
VRWRSALPSSSWRSKMLLCEQRARQRTLSRRSRLIATPTRRCGERVHDRAWSLTRRSLRSATHTYRRRVRS